PAPPPPSSLLDAAPMPNPDLMPLSRQGASRQGTARPTSPSHSKSGILLPGIPTRQSVHPVPAPAPAPAPAPMMAPAPVPAPMYAPPVPQSPESAIMHPASSVRSSVRASIYAGSNPLPPDPEPNPMMGPVGFLALGATVAVACYLLVTNLLR